jgi:nucleotide-binding universal stress UspA family protein
MFKNILIAIDGSELAEHALTNGLSLAKSMAAKVQLILVDAPMHAAEIKRQATRTLKHAAEQAKLAGVPCDTIQVEHDHPDQAIVAAAKDKECDLIVMASHGHRRLSTALLGSVTLDVLRHTNIPVLIWR